MFSVGPRHLSAGTLQLSERLYSNTLQDYTFIITYDNIIYYWCFYLKYSTVHITREYYIRTLRPYVVKAIEHSGHVDISDSPRDIRSNIHPIDDCFITDTLPGFYSKRIDGPRIILFSYIFVYLTYRLWWIEKKSKTPMIELL